MAKDLHFEFNKLYRAVFTTAARYIDLWGGRARGGSHFGTDYFLFLIVQPKYFRGCFLRAVFGDIRGSLWQDFKDRVDKAIEKGDVELKDFAFNESLLTVTYKPTGNTIISKGFKKASGSQSAKLKSLAGMTHVLIEECEEVAEDDFNKLDDSIRTTKVEHIQVVRLFNPPSKNHWLIKRNYNLTQSGHKGWYKATAKDIPELLSIHSIYLDNIQNLNQSTIDKYRNYGDKSSPKYDEDFYYRDVLGLVSEGRRGRIITNAKPIATTLFNELPYPSFYGLDWGFNDPNAVVELKYHVGQLFVRQIVYQAGMDNEELMTAMRQRRVLPRAKVYYDSARPDNAKTFKKGIEYGPKAMKGFNMIPSWKGPNSITFGIAELQNVELFITEDSTDIWLEIEEYHWALDADKNPTDEPEDEYNHAIDAIRYAYVGEVVKRSMPVVGNNSGDSRSKLDWIDEVKTGPAHRDEIARELDDDDIEDFLS